MWNCVLGILTITITHVVCIRPTSRKHGLSQLNRIIFARQKTAAAAPAPALAQENKKKEEEEDGKKTPNA